MKELESVLKEMVSEKRDIILSVLFGVLAGITAVGLFAASGFLISKAALLPPIQTLAVLIAVQKLSSLTRAVSRYAERYYSHRATFTILGNLRTSFYRRLEPLAPGIFNKYRSGDLLARIVGDVESLQHTFLRVLYPPIVLVLVFLCTIFFVSFFAIEVSLLLLAGAVLTGFIIPALFAVRERRLARTVRARRAVLSTEVTELLQGYRDLKIYQQLDEKERLLAEASAAYVSEQRRRELDGVRNLSVNTFATFIISWLVLGLGAWLVTEGELDGVFLALLVMTSLTVFENAAPMAILPGFFEDSRHAAVRLEEVVSEERVQAESGMPEGPVSIVFNDVSFNYPGEARPAVSGVSFELPAGSKTAIVGASGSGKSTLLQLLLLMYPATGITINGTDARRIDQESLYAIANVALQQNHFFYGTIRDNLLLAGEIADKDLLAALEAVALGHLTLEDQVFEKGENLSGGERQRLAIARLLLREARIWLLDEPTSSVDPVTEAQIHEQLLAAVKDGTFVLVSHRLQGLERMDQILVMDEGRLVESGTYAELMEARGYFYEMKQIEQAVLA